MLKIIYSGNYQILFVLPQNYQVLPQVLEKTEAKMPRAWQKRAWWVLFTIYHWSWMNQSWWTKESTRYSLLAQDFGSHWCHWEAWHSKQHDQPGLIQIMLRKIMGTQKAQAELQVKLRSESLEQGKAWSWGKALGLLGTIWDRWEKRRQKKDSNLFCRKGPASTRSSHSLSFPFLTSLSPFFLPYLPHHSPLFLLLSLFPGSSRPSPSFSRNRAIMEEHPVTWKLSLPLAAAW